MIKSNGNNRYENYTFSGNEWSAPRIVDADEICSSINGFNLIGRTIKDVTFIGHCYNLRRERIEDCVYSSLKALSEDKRQQNSGYENISDDFLYPRYAEIDEPFLIRFEKKIESDDVFEIDAAQHPEYRFSMNCIPWDIEPGVNARNASARILFEPCIGRKIVGLEVNTYVADTDLMYRAPFDGQHSKRELVSAVTIWLDNDIGICVEGRIDFCYVSCVNRKSEILDIPFSQLRKALFNWEDLHIDQITGFESDSASFFFGEIGSQHASQPFMSLSANNCESVLNIAEEDFTLFGWCISDLYEWFYEYEDYEYSYDQWQRLLAEGDKLLSFETFDELFNYRIGLFQSIEDNCRDNYFLIQMNYGGAGFWKNRDKYHRQLTDMKNWSYLVLKPEGLMTIQGF